MKKLVIFGTILVLLVVAVAPVMAKSPGHGNGNGNGNGNGGKVTTPVPSVGTTEDQNGNNGRGNGNKTNRGMVNATSHGLGAKNKQHKSMPFYLQGNLDAVTEVKVGSTVTDTITVSLTHGNAQVKSFIGSSLTITVTQSTIIYKLNQGVDNGNENGESNESGEPAKVRISFAELIPLINNKVAVHGRVLDGVYTATMITVYLQTPVEESGGG